MRKPRSEKLPDGAKDARAVLSKEDKQTILDRWNNPLDDVSQRQLARDFGCSRRTIQFIVDPEKLAANKAIRRERIKANGSYYDRDKQREYMRKFRAHLKEERAKAAKNV